MADSAKASNAIVQLVGFYADALGEARGQSGSKDELIVQLRKQLVDQSRKLQLAVALADVLTKHIKTRKGADVPVAIRRALDAFNGDHDG